MGTLEVDLGASQQFVQPPALGLMPPGAAQQHPHVSETLCERGDVHLRSLRFQLIDHALQRAHLTFVGMMRRKKFDDLFHLFELGWQRIKPRQLRLLSRGQLLGHAGNLVVAAVLLVPGGAQGQGVAARWQFEIRGTSGSGNEMGDLRIDGVKGRLLLAFDDSAFQPLEHLKIEKGRISFALAGGRRQFDGTVTDTAMHGTMRDVTGATHTWDALPLSPASTIWPVPPRVTVRQLVMGTSRVTVRVPAHWAAMVPTRAAIETEYGELAHLAGASPLTADARAERAQLFVLGFDESARASARALIARIARSSAADATFQRLFGGVDAKTDLHDAALSYAPLYLQSFRLITAGDGLQQLGELADSTNALGVRESAWRLWSRMAKDSVAILSRIATLTGRDPQAGKAVFALIAGYGDALKWWREATQWLLTKHWLDTPSGARSPAQLVAQFWSVDSLALPDINPARFGAAAAIPIVSALHIGPHLMRARNASATEWLAGAGMREAFDAWRPLRWGEIPLVVEIGGEAETVLSPWAQGEARPSAFFGDRDAIRIDPGFSPFAAVATIVHEWHHLLAAQRRLAGAHPPALVDGPVQLRLLEDDPWIAEGFAEWATEETLRPAGASAALLNFSQAEKRLAIAERNAEDPHAIGYGLVRGAAAGRSTSAVRDLLVASLHDLGLVARRLKLSAPTAGRRPDVILHRPANAAVIPGITFTWDEGTVFDLSRRLVIPNTRSEH